MTDDERERFAKKLESTPLYEGCGDESDLPEIAAAQLRADGERIKALEAALGGVVALYDDPALIGVEDYQDEIDRRLRRARDALRAARERRGG